MIERLSKTQGKNSIDIINDCLNDKLLNGKHYVIVGDSNIKKKESVLLEKND